MKPITLVILAALAAKPCLASDVVRAENYDAFWLWAGVKSRPVLDQAKTIYLLQGEIGHGQDGAVRVKAQGATEPGPHKPTIWLAYRVRALDWDQSIFVAINDRLAAWQAFSGEIAGVQIDFDASTRGLENYADFLQRLRQHLPKHDRLSITGLMDWASQGDPQTLDALSKAVDEVIFQTYRGHDTLADINAYLARLHRVKIPFKIGLAEGSSWSPTEQIDRNPNFRGYIVFLQNHRQSVP
jgi:hypothetical protein